MKTQYFAKGIGMIRDEVGRSDKYKTVVDS